MLALSLLAVPGLADENTGQFEPLSPEFLVWQEEQELPSAKNGGASDIYPEGHVPFPVDLSCLAGNPPVEASLYPNRNASSLPSKYDLRSVNGKSYVTSVKSQLPYGTCWSFAAIGAMESNLLMQGLGTYDLSEMHLAWFAFRGDDKSGAFHNMHSSSFSTVMNNGGNSFYPAALFTRLSGPASESDVPYGEDKKPSKGSPDSYTRAARLREVYYLNFTNEPNINASSAARDIVKRRIMETGAVVGNYYNRNASYNVTAAGGTSYYYSSSSSNHAVQIIGWDDNYSRTNFKTNPGMDGAWLIKNSWGDTWYTGDRSIGDDGDVGDNGCFWMSYAQHLTEGSAFIAEAADTDMRAYYYDALGWCSTLAYSGSTVHAANVFKAERNETLTEVGFITPDNNIAYEINIYAGMSAMPSSSPIPSGNRAGLSSVSGTMPYSGYHTVTLGEPVTLSEGEYFSVVVTFTNTARVPVERAVSGWSNNAAIEEGSFFSYNGTTWTTGKSQSANATIKAFTVTGSVSGTAPRIHDGYPPDAYLNSPYSAYVTASGTSPITWTASAKIPAGLSMNASTGEISGTPAAEGNFTFSVTASNSYGSDTKYYTMNVWDVPAIEAGEITGYVGYSMSHQMTLTQSLSAAWSTTDKLPAGLSLSKSGLISGRPTKAGTYSAVLKAVSSAGTSQASVTFSINAKPVKPTIKLSGLKAVMIGEEFSQDIEATGTEPITITIEGQPDGITLNGTTAFMSGAAQTAGTFNIKITAENIATSLDKKPVTKTVKLTVKARVPVISAPSSLDDAVMGEEYYCDDFGLSDGTEPVTWKLSGQPSGLSMNSYGVISGKPTRSGKFTLVVRASNSGGYDTVRMPLTVLQKPAITTTRIAVATTDKKYSAKLSAKGSTPITWDISGLPDTLTFTQNEAGTYATITGTPTAAEDYVITARASNKAGDTESEITLRVAGVAPKMNAALSRGTVGEDYEETRIFATGTKPVEITCSISEPDMAALGIESLEDLGLVLVNDPDSGTAVLAGMPEISVKSLPLTFTARNAISYAVKKAYLTLKGEKPVITLPEENTVNITCAVNSGIELDFEAEGTRVITYSMNRVNGFTLEQTGDYDAVLTGTAPARDSTTTITVTASNADGKAAKRVVIKTMTPPEINTASFSGGGYSAGTVTLPAGTMNKFYSVKLSASGTKSITWTLEGDLPEGLKFSGGTISGKPKEAGDFTFTVTANNAVGEDTRDFALTVTDPYAEAGSLPETREAGSSKPAEDSEPESVPEAEEMTAEPEISFGAERASSPHQSEIEGEGYIIAAVLPEITVNVSGMYDIEAELSENAPAGAKLYWLAYPDGEGSEDDEIAEFYDEAGAEIETVPDSRKIVVSVWLNEGVKYSPVIAVK